MCGTIGPPSSPAGLNVRLILQQPTNTPAMMLTSYTLLDTGKILRVLYTQGYWRERAAFQRSAFGRSTAGNDVVATIFIRIFFFSPFFFPVFFFLRRDLFS